jgi:sulfotransferase family protein
MASLTKQLTEDARIRKVLIPAYRAMARAMVFRPGPRVLVNGMAKTGTHLASALLKNLPKMMFSGRHYSLVEFSPDPRNRIPIGEVPPVDWTLFRRTMATVNNGQFMTAHFPGLDEIFSVLEELNYKTIVILRDPRDVIVSSAFFITKLKRHDLHDRFTNEFGDMSSRLFACIQGLPRDDRGLGMEPIGNRIANQLPWLRAPNAYVCRFETLVGPRGGGSAVEQINEIRAIAAHIDRPLTEQQAHRVADRTWSPSSPTFRKGSIADWRNHFTDAHKATFKEVAGEALIELGYEESLDW